MRSTLFLLLCISMISLSWAQERVHSGVMYQPSDTIYSPIYGVEAQILEGWYGVLPQDTELFLLTSDRGDDTQIFVRASENTSENIQQSWQEGLELTNNLKVVVTDSVQYRGDVMYADVKVAGTSTGNYQAYVEAKCGAYGKCVVFFLISQANNFDELKEQLTQIVDNTTLKKPSENTRYDDFNWQEFLSGKYLASINQRNYKNQKEINEVHLKKDGKFRSRIEQRGMVDQKKSEYWGNNKGEWSIEGSGKEATLVLNFKKHEPLQIGLVIDEDKIYLNGQRFYAMYDQ